MRFQTLVLAAVLVLAGGGASADRREQNQTFDILIRNARIFDGSGNPWLRGDVAIQDGRVAAVGDLQSATATRTIDAAGRFLSPGFIDIHSHSDRGLGDDALKYNVNMVAQGITLSVVNQDGRSPLPIRDQKARYEKAGIGNNVALMVGHGAVRNRVMGDRANKVATDADVQAMKALVAEGMKDGAYGLSTGL